MIFFKIGFCEGRLWKGERGGQRGSLGIFACEKAKWGRKEFRTQLACYLALIRF